MTSNQTQAISATSGTLFSASTSSVVERWGDRISAPPFYMPDLSAADAEPLTLAVAEHVKALTPATRDQRERLLMGLRSATIIRNEDRSEARATFTLLAEHLSDVPEDILADACLAYVNAPGPRFFPKAAGELRTFTQPLLEKRFNRAKSLSLMARHAETLRKAEADRPKPTSTMTAEEIADWNETFAAAGAETRYDAHGNVTTKAALNALLSDPPE